MGTGFAGFLFFLHQVEPLLSGLLVHFEEVAAVVVVESFQADSVIAAVALAALTPGNFQLPPVIL